MNKNMNRQVNAVLGLVLLAVGTLAGCSIVRGFSNGLEPPLTEAIEQTPSLELISIDPNIREGGTYHYWKELGRTTISSEDTKRKIAAALNDAVRQSDGTVAGCFNPRHAIKMDHEGSTYEVIICFECMSLQVHKDGKRIGEHTITQTHSGYFNQLLRDADLPIAE